MPRTAVVSLALLLGLSLGGSSALAQSPDPSSPDGTAQPGITRSEAISLVLAGDPRFADLPDWEDLRIRGTQEFRTFEYLLMSDYYRVLGPFSTESSELGWITLRHPGSWLIEVTLTEGCSEYVEDVIPQPDPCAWRHAWYHRVEPDGSVTLLFDEGGPEPVPELLEATTG